MSDLGGLSRLSRVLLEPVMVRAYEVGDLDLVADIALELGSRTWQHTNPYPTVPGLLAFQAAPEAATARLPALEGHGGVIP